MKMDILEKFSRNSHKHAIVHSGKMINLSVIYH